MDTTHILFICGGTFTGLEDIINKRLGRQLIGFASEDHDAQTPSEHSDVLAQVQPDDLVQFGMIPEMVGRLPGITTLGQLDKNAMVRILTEPKNAIVKQYQQLFHMSDAKLEFTDEALQAISAKALKRDVGARALRSVVEELVIDLMYDLPDQSDEGAEYEITEKMVNGETEVSLFATRKVKKESA